MRIDRTSEIHKNMKIGAASWIDRGSAISKLIGQNGFLAAHRFNSRFWMPTFWILIKLKKVTYVSSKDVSFDLRSSFKFVTGIMHKTEFQLIFRYSGLLDLLINFMFSRLILPNRFKIPPIGRSTFTCILTFVPYFHQFSKRAVMPGIKCEDSTQQMNLRKFADTSASERLFDVRISWIDHRVIG